MADVATLLAELATLHQEPGEPPLDYVARATGLLDQLQAVDSPVTEAHVVSALIRGLSPEYGIAQYSLAVQPVATLREALSELLLASELRRSKQLQQCCAATPGTGSDSCACNGTPADRGCACRGTPVGLKAGGQKRTLNGTRQHQPFGPNSHRPERRGLPSHRMLPRKARGAGPAGPAAGTAYVLDSGALCHVTDSWSHLHDYRPYPQPQSRALRADGRVAHSHGRGTLVLAWTDAASNTINTIRISDVEYVPEARCKLISQGALDRRRHRIAVGRGRARVTGWCPSTRRVETFLTADLVDGRYLVGATPMPAPDHELETARAPRH